LQDDQTEEGSKLN